MKTKSKPKPPVKVGFSMRKLDQHVLDELRMMRIRQRRTMEDVCNEAISIGVNVMKARELRARNE